MNSPVYRWLNVDLVIVAENELDRFASWSLPRYGSSNGCVSEVTHFPHNPGTVAENPFGT
jgi:hypothetical protein